MKYKLAIFDLDGTLLDTLEDLHNSVNYALTQNDMPQRTLEEVRTFVGNGIRLLIERSVLAGTDINTLDKTFEDFKQHYQQHCNDKTAPYPNILDTLLKLKNEGYKLAVLSNKAQPAVTKLCDIYFKDLLDAAIGAKPDIPKKPAPDALFLCAKELNININDVVYIGDSDVDVHTARNAGVAGIAVTWGFRSEESLINAGAVNLAKNANELFDMLV